MKIGTVVQITDAWEVYPKYREMFKRLKFKNHDFNHIDDVQDVLNWKVFTPMVKHCDSGDILVGIQKGNKQLLMSTLGLKVSKLQRGKKGYAKIQRIKNENRHNSKRFRFRRDL